MGGFFVGWWGLWVTGAVNVSVRRDLDTACDQTAFSLGSRRARTVAVLRERYWADDDAPLNRHMRMVRCRPSKLHIVRRRSLDRLNMLLASWSDTPVPPQRAHQILDYIRCSCGRDTECVGSADLCHRKRSATRHECCETIIWRADRASLRTAKDRKQALKVRLTCESVFAALHSPAVSVHPLCL